MLSSDEEYSALSVLGVTSAAEIPLIVPHGYVDYRTVTTRLTDRDDLSQSRVIRGSIAEAPAFGFTASGNRPRLQIVLLIEDGKKLVVSLYGANPERDKFFKLLHEGRKMVHFRCTGIASLGSSLYLNKPEFVRLLFVGRVVPEYLGKRGSIKPDEVQRHVLTTIKLNAPLAADLVLSKCFSGAHKSGDGLVGKADAHLLESVFPRAYWHRLLTWEDVFKLVTETISVMHLPSSVEQGKEATSVMERLSALGVLVESRALSVQVGARRLDEPLVFSDRLSSLPFSLSESQSDAVSSAIADMSSGTAMRRLLYGDVGSGKTVVYALIAMSVIDAGGIVAILLPSETLASRIYAELNEFWPDVKDVSYRVSASKGRGKLFPANVKMFVGTTALLHQLPSTHIDLVIVDEQQRFSAPQREKLMSEGTHLLEVTATPIPRTQALIKYGSTPVSRLSNRVPKMIVTQIYNSASKAKLFQGVRESLSRDEKILVVYAMKSSSGSVRSKSEVQNLDDAYRRWSSSIPEARIEVLHGDMPADKVASVLSKLDSGETNIVLSTSIIEAGLNIKGLMRVVVINAEMHGLLNLHQIRGRIARYGGVGYFDLLPSPEAKEQSLVRLEVLCSTEDGTEVAEKDLALRGAGDISKAGTTQSGNTAGILYGACNASPYLELMAQSLNEAGY